MAPPRVVRRVLTADGRTRNLERPSVGDHGLWRVKRVHGGRRSMAVTARRLRRVAPVDHRGGHGGHWSLRGSLPSGSCRSCRPWLSLVDGVGEQSLDLLFLLTHLCAPAGESRPPSGWSEAPAGMASGLPPASLTDASPLPAVPEGDIEPGGVHPHVAAHDPGQLDGAHLVWRGPSEETGRHVVAAGPDERAYSDSPRMRRESE
jgi:hypothetical protein